MKTILDNEGRVIDETISYEMAKLEKPFREGMRLKKFFIGKAKVILEGEELSEKFLEGKLDHLKVAQEEKRIEDEKNEAIRKEEERLSEAKAYIKNLAEGKGKDISEFEKLDKEKKNILFEKLSKIFDSEGLDGLIKHFGIKSSYGDCMTAEEVINKLFELNIHGTFCPIIEKVAGVYLTTNNYDDHSLCHLFERYGKSEKHMSFAGNEALYPIASKLMENSIKKEGNCMGRVLSPLPKLAFKDIEEGRYETFTFKPECVDDVKVRKSLDIKYEYLLYYLSGAKTPKEYIGKLLEWALHNQGSNEPQDFLKNKFKNKKLADSIYECLGDSVTPEDKNIIAEMIDKSIKRDEENKNKGVYLSADKQDYLDVICIDVDDTLIIDGNLHSGLVDMMTKNIYQGNKIIVFSSGNSEMQTKRLRDLGLDEIFLPVISKDLLKGVKVYKIIDDTKPEEQGLTCSVHSEPKWY